MYELYAAQKIKFFIKDLFSKFDQIAFIEEIINGNIQLHLPYLLGNLAELLNHNNPAFCNITVLIILL